MSLPFNTLLGKTFKSVTLHKEWNMLTFMTETEKFELMHCEDSSENVYIESIVGDLEDLIDSPILVAEEATSQENERIPEEKSEALWKEVWFDSYTWTFYKLATAKGWVDIRFYGESNGHYSETADLYREEL